MHSEQVIPAETHSAPAPADYESLKQAAEWYALLHSGDASEAHRAAWRNWLNGEPRHRQAWQYVEAVGRRFECLKSKEDNDRAVITALKAARDQPLTRRKAVASLGVVLVGGLLGWGVWRTDLPELALAWNADLRTGTGETRKELLADGSRIWLNTATAVNVDYSAQRRSLTLLSGEILIETAPDAARPFIVETSQGTLRALGTRFNVREMPDAIALAVFAGAVEIRTARSDVTRILKAGQQTQFTQSKIAPPVAADRAREAWTQGVLLAEDIPLKTLVAELERYRYGRLNLAPEVAGMRVMGAYPANDSERALSMLEDALPIRVRRILPWWISIEPQ